MAIARTYIGLSADRRFLIPAATVSLIMGGLFSMFSAAPRVLIAGMRVGPVGLGRAIRSGLLLATAGSIAILLTALFNSTFLPFLGAMSLFLLGMGIVNP